MKAQENDKKGCLIALAFAVSGFIVFWIACEYDLPILKDVSYTFPAYGGIIFGKYSRNETWTKKKHILLFILTMATFLVVAYILHGRLW